MNNIDMLLEYFSENSNQLNDDVDRDEAIKEAVEAIREGQKAREGYDEDKAIEA